MRWFVLLAAVLLAALALQAGLLAFAVYVLLGVLLLSRHLAKKWVGSLEAVRETSHIEPLEIGESVEAAAQEVLGLIARREAPFSAGWETWTPPGDWRRPELHARWRDEPVIPWTRRAWAYPMANSFG